MPLFLLHIFSPLTPLLFLHRKTFCSSPNITIYIAMFMPRIISSPEPLGSQGELIVYPSSRRPSASASSVGVGVVRRHSQYSKIFSSETAGPIKAKFYVEPPWVGGTIFCSRHLGHMTKMAVTPIYGKNPSKSSSPEPAGRFSRNLVCSIGDSSPL